MLNTKRFILTTLGIISIYSFQLFAASSQEVQEVIRARAEYVQEFRDTYLQDETISGVVVLPIFYEKRNFMPAWTERDKIDQLFDLIESMILEGLNPQDYHQEELIRLRDKLKNTANPSAELIADYDITLSDALLRIFYHLLYGKVDPERLDANWNIYTEIDINDGARWLQSAIDSPDINKHFAEKKSKYRFFILMRQALAKYRALDVEGGWPVIPPGETLKPGMEDSRFPLIRERLILTDDYKGPNSSDEYVYDETMELAVKHFQIRHGLNPDGVIGKNTLEEMNIPIEKRIEQLLVNLERGRWVYRDITDNFILVNIAAFSAAYVKDNEIVWKARAQVGKDYRQTPIFKADLQYIVFNPTWTVPPTIMAKDVLPAIKKDQSYLKRKKMKVIDRKGKIIDPAKLNWDKYNSQNFPYMIRQDPGPHNALGRVKFIFPNEHFVFLHDTPSQALFNRESRAFSSGCIRVEDPFRLAEKLLDDENNWSRDKIMELIRSEKTKTVHLKTPISVLLLYATAFPAYEDDIIEFRKDIYNRDAAILKGLQDTFRRKKRHVINQSRQ
ncbi:L,D-transpeptidase family protein [bacterium]|nr:L,D-transpeptidase family protein [bacterium]